MHVKMFSIIAVILPYLRPGDQPCIATGAACLRWALSKLDCWSLLQIYCTDATCFSFCAYNVLERHVEGAMRTFSISLCTHIIAHSNTECGVL
jgi:hypothetical protein